MALKAGIELRFHPKEQNFPAWYPQQAEDPKTEDGPEHPCFFASGPYRSSQNIEFHCETYQFYFEENLGIGLFGIGARSKLMGYHKHDVEAVIVLCDKDTKEPVHVYFKAHGTGQGAWKDWDKCDKNEDGALVVYVAWGSHATYSEPGAICRIFGFANDCTSHKGRRILITAKNCVPAPQKQLASGIKISETIYPVPKFSIREHERFFLPIVIKRLRNRAIPDWNFAQSFAK